jgi:hypothetical protein
MRIKSRIRTGKAIMPASTENLQRAWTPMSGNFGDNIVSAVFGFWPDLDIASSAAHLALNESWT